MRRPIVRGDDGEDDSLAYRPLEKGFAEGAPDGQPDAEKPIAVLWLPDPEQRRGWRENYIKRADPQTERRIGFRPGMT